MLMGTGLLERVIGRSWDLVWFGVRPLDLIHLRTWSMSCWRSDTSVAESTGLKRRMSSAYNIGLAFWESGRQEIEFMK